MAAKARRLALTCRFYIKEDIRLPGTGDSKSHGARPVHQIISMIMWILTSRVSILCRVLVVSLGCVNPKPWFAELDVQGQWQRKHDV